MKIIKFYLAILIFCFTLLEVCLRFYEKFNPIIFASEYGIPCLEKIDDKIYYTLKRNCRTNNNYRYINSKINFSTNSCRMREVEEYCIYLENKKLKKIFFFGDSYTQNPYVKNDLNYSKVLLEKIREKDLDYIDINFGVSGYSIIQNLDNLKKRIKDDNITSKDKIIFQFLLNDIYDITQHPPHPLKKYLNNFYSFKIANYLRRKIIFQDEYINLEDMIFKDYQKNKNLNIIKNKLCELSKIINENNFELYFLYLPYMELRSAWGESKEDHLMNYVLNVAQKCGIKNIINPSEKLKNYPYTDLVISVNENRHLSPKGNKVVAEYIFNSLIEMNTFNFNY